MAKKNKIDWKVVLGGIVCITFLEAIALFKGYDGTGLAIVIAIIACAIGVMIPLDKIIKK